MTRPRPYCSSQKREGPGDRAPRAYECRWRGTSFLNELTELSPRCQHPLQHGRGVIFPLPDEALLMRLEVRDTPTDLLALGATPIHWRPG
jgi:hypothetical protein